MVKTAEYIEREAALSAQNKSMNLAECRKRLERLPAADVVEVVRCKDCKYNKTLDKHYSQCGFNYQFGPQDFFCMAGERRTDD